MKLPAREWLTPREVADYLGYSDRQIRRWAEAGLLVAFKIPTRGEGNKQASMRIKRQSVIDMVHISVREYQEKNGIVFDDTDM